MTDKQIIIDDQKKTIHRLQDECTEKTNVIIALGEQLKAKEQECEKLKKQIESYKGLITDAGKQNYQLMQEYDKLKTENEELKKKCNIYTCGIYGNKEDCNKLYKTLTEIKEIAEDFCNACKEFEPNKCNEINSRYCNYGRILQKISEVDVENEN